MRKFRTLKGGKEQSYNPKLTAAHVALAKTESEIKKLLNILSGVNPLPLQYANTRIKTGSVTIEVSPAGRSSHR